MNKIICGDAIEELKKLPEKSINMVMTSPPYWALRDYGSDVETIWDTKKYCEHDFKLKEVQAGTQHWNQSGKVIPTKERKIHNEKIMQIGFCNKCNAWKGQLGLEPTFDLYIKHLCDIFDEVQRVLRDDGTCWVNLGDTYYGSGAGTQKNLPEESKSKEVYTMPYLAHKHTQRGGWERPSRVESNKAVSNKNCLYCGKKFKGRLNMNFCSRECLNSVGNEARTVNRQLKDKCLTLIPMRFAIEMVNRGWILRNTIIWHKPNAMPSSVKDRFTVDFEYLFFFSKKKKYYFETQYESLKTSSIERLSQDIENQKGLQRGTDGLNDKRIVKAVASKMPPIGGRKHVEGKSNINPTYSGNQPEWNLLGKNKRCVWTINPQPFPYYICNKCGYYGKSKSIKEEKGYFGGEGKDKRSCLKCGKKIDISHFAIYPEELCETPIKAGCPEGGIVLDPFFGAGTTGLVALKQNKKFIGIELNKEYIEIANKRLKPYLEQTKLQ